TFKRMFGYEDQELPNVSTTWQTLIFAEDMPKVDQSLAAHVQSQGQIPLCVEVRYHHKNGSTVWVICTGLVIDWDEEGNPLRAIGCHVDITEQKRTEDKLRTSLQEKEILLKEIHHRVKNNLLIVASLLNWQGESIQDPAILHLLADSQKRINAMALIHEKLYRSTDLTHIDLGDYLKTLTTQIFDSFCSDPYLIHFHYSLCPLSLSVETVTP
ncbi:MAG: histidine kinase dimerization/phosphoacceptor domain -containing protein, partial [Microcystaceae cyanobacterium]